jgi:hypothetical protein
MTLIISKGLTLDNGTRAAAIAGVSPTLDYRFAREKREIETVSLTGKLTYTGGNGTFTGSDGFIQPATTNVPRFDHDPLSRQSLGLLSEVERTNLLLRSEEFNEANWTKIGSLVLGKSSASPTGALTAAKVVEDTSTGSHRVHQQVTTNSESYTSSYFVKAAERTYCQIRCQEGGSFLARAEFNLSTGVAVPVTGQASIVNIGDGWYRVSLSAASGGSGTFQSQLWLGDQTNALTYTGDGTSGLFLWGAQLEAASSASTYIPTTDAAVTRTADSAVIDGTGIITGTYTMVEKPAGCAVVSGTNINLEPGFTAERIMVFPAALDAGQITAIRGAM